MIALYNEALAEKPDHPALVYNLACMEALAGRTDDALAHLERAIELRPEFAETRREGRGLRLDQGRSALPRDS